MNLMEGLLQEMNRCRELLKEYEAIGAPGVFGATMIRQQIKNAEKSISEGDTIGMMTAYTELEGCN